MAPVSAPAPRTPPAVRVPARPTWPTKNAGAAGQRGCIDIARARGSGTISGGDKATFEYYAFALDAVTLGDARASRLRRSLTRQQVKDIYACNITDWGTVGGTPGPIQRYLPQSALGHPVVLPRPVRRHRRHAARTDHRQLPGGEGQQHRSTPTVARTSSSRRTRARTIEAGDIDKAILPYSAGVWSYQSANVGQPRHRRPQRRPPRWRQRPGGGSPGRQGQPRRVERSDRDYDLDNSAGGVVNENNVTQANPASRPTNDYLGIRYVFNILDNQATSLGYQAAFNMVGFTNTPPAAAKSPLCSNDGGLATTSRSPVLPIPSVGFAPLGTTGNNPLRLEQRPAATCRKFIPGLIHRSPGCGRRVGPTRDPHAGAVRAGAAAGSRTASVADRSTIDAQPTRNSISFTRTSQGEHLVHTHACTVAPKRRLALLAIVAMLGALLAVSLPASADTAGNQVVTTATTPYQTNVAPNGPLTGLKDGTSSTSRDRHGDRRRRPTSSSGIDARLCRAGLNIQLLGAVQRLAGNCIANPLSPATSPSCRRRSARRTRRARSTSSSRRAPRRWPPTPAPARRSCATRATPCCPLGP